MDDAERQQAQAEGVMMYAYDEGGGYEEEEPSPMEKILEQMQGENFSHAPGEEMTHVAGVSFVDDLGLSLGGMYVCMYV